MKIAQISPLVESVPPALYGGTDRIVSYLTEALVDLGHEVTLFASGDSRTAAELVPVVPRALRLNSTVRDYRPYDYILLNSVLARANEFDILHFHIEMAHFPIFRTIQDRAVTTLHGRLDLPDLHALYRAFPQAPLVSISNAQRAPMPPANWLATVHHGLPRDLLRFHPDGGRYLAFLGRICPEKGPLTAIAIAERCGLPLKIAAKVDPVDRDYFRAQIAPLLGRPGIEYVGEIDDGAKDSFLGGACAVIFPVDWPEPFGLVMIEAMACGTPVIAFRRGAVEEVLEDGVTGYIVEDADEAVAAIRNVEKLDRRRIRQRFEERFTVDSMVSNYVAVYEEMLDTLATHRAA